MTKKLLLAGTILILLACAVMAADAVTGKWTFTQAARNNGSPARVTTLDLKADGAALTGTVTAPMGGRGGGAGTPIPIANGKVKGNTVSFEVVRTFSGNPVTTKYTGTVAGDAMRLKQTIDLGKGPQTVSVDAKRAAP